MARASIAGHLPGQDAVNRAVLLNPARRADGAVIHHAALHVNHVVVLDAGLGLVSLQIAVGSANELGLLDGGGIDCDGGGA